MALNVAYFVIPAGVGCGGVTKFVSDLKILDSIVTMIPRI